jgi:hypothetical protein
MVYKFKKGDEIQAMGSGHSWVIGTFEEYKDGQITMSGCVPLYDQNTVHENPPTLTFVPSAVWIYSYTEPKPVLTWNANSGNLEQHIEGLS